MGSSSPWDITANNNVINGYTDTTKVTCSNGAMAASYSLWTIKQTYCSGSGLTVPTDLIPETLLKFDASTTTEIIYPQTTTWQGWDIFFNN